MVLILLNRVWFVLDDFLRIIHKFFFFFFFFFKLMGPDTPILQMSYAAATIIRASLKPSLIL